MSVQEATLSKEHDSPTSDTASLYSTFNPASLIQWAVAVIAGLLIPATWVITSKITRMQDGVYWPMAYQYSGAAIVLYIIPLLRRRHSLRITYKSAQAAVTLAVLYYFIPSFICFIGLKSLPPLFAIMTLGLVPLYLWIYNLGIGKYRLLFLTLGFSGIVLFFLGTIEEKELSLQSTKLLSYLFLGSVIFSIGLAFCKKVFWIHSSQDLTFFAMLFAGGLFAVCGLVMGEPVRPALSQEQLKEYQVYLILLGPVATGFGAYCYRYAASVPARWSTLVITTLIPVAALVVSLLSARKEFTFNIYSISGFLIFLGSLMWGSRTESPNNWMTHHFNNTRRRGDRMLCHLKGFIKISQGTLARIELTDLSIGGLGFYCDTAYSAGQIVMVTFPLGDNWNQVSLEGRVMHFSKVTGESMPYVGGIEFLKIKDDILQVLVEFLARLSLDGEQDIQTANRSYSLPPRLH